MGFILFHATLSLSEDKGLSFTRLTQQRMTPTTIPFPLSPRTLLSYMENRSEEICGSAEPMRYRLGSCLFPSATSLSCSPSPHRQLLPRIVFPFSGHIPVPLNTSLFQGTPQTRPGLVMGLPTSSPTASLSSRSDLQFLPCHMKISISNQQHQLGRLLFFLSLETRAKKDKALKLYKLSMRKQAEITENITTLR